jgi:hypothetical protein
VAPVEIPLEDTEEAKSDNSKDTDSGFFGKISEFGKRAKRQWPFSDLFGGGDDPKKQSSEAESAGLFDSTNFIGWFGGSDGTGDKPKSESRSSASSAISESESGEILHVTTPQDDKYRNKRSTASDDITGEVNVVDLEDADDDIATDHPESDEVNETDEEATAAVHKPSQVQHLNSDDEDYIGEAASGSGMESRTVPPTSPAPPTDRQPSELCTLFCRA